MPDFESGLVSATRAFTTICTAGLSRCYLECHINLPKLSGSQTPGIAKNSADNRRVVVLGANCYIQDFALHSRSIISYHPMVSTRDWQLWLLLRQM
jgi:hypothetical protein